MRTHRWGAGLVSLALLAGCAALPEAPAQGGFVAREILLDGRTHRYQVFVPAARARQGQPPPVVLFLHGSGERGEDNLRQLSVGLGPYLRAHAAQFPALVVLPQAPEGQEWNQLAPVVFAQLEAATREFGGDRARTVLTGLSMGGYGTWDFALREPGRFSALVPVCGGLVHPGRPSMAVGALAGLPDPEAELARRLPDTPVWLFHGARDEVVPADHSRRLAAALRAAGGAEVRYTEFPDAGHNSWDAAYATPGLWDWLWRQRR